MANVYKAKPRTNLPLVDGPINYDLFVEQSLMAVDESGELEVLVYHSTDTRQSFVNQQNILQAQIEDLQERINAIDQYIADNP